MTQFSVLVCNNGKMCRRIGVLFISLQPAVAAENNSCTQTGFWLILFPKESCQQLKKGKLWRLQ